MYDPYLKKKQKQELQPWRKVQTGIQHIGPNLSSQEYSILMLGRWFSWHLAHFQADLIAQEIYCCSATHVQFFLTPWTAARQASLSINNSRSLLKLMSIESVMPSKHLILCHPLLLLPSIFPSIMVFSNESALHQVAKVLELQHLSFQWIFMVDFL